MPMIENANTINTETIRFEFFIFSFQFQEVYQGFLNHTSEDLFAPVESLSLLDGVRWPRRYILSLQPSLENYRRGQEEACSPGPRCRKVISKAELSEVITVKGTTSLCASTQSRRQVNP